MGSMVVLLSRNIKIDGMDGGWELGYGGRLLIGSVMEEDGKDSYWRAGYGQFSNVEFKVCLKIFFLYKINKTFYIDRINPIYTLDVIFIDV